MPKLPQSARGGIPGKDEALWDPVKPGEEHWKIPNPQVKKTAICTHCKEVRPAGQRDVQHEF